VESGEEVRGVVLRVEVFLLTPGCGREARQDQYGRPKQVAMRRYAMCVESRHASRCIDSRLLYGIPDINRYIGILVE